MASRTVRMLRTALGPAVGRFLDEPDIVEVMLNPDGRIWVDRLGAGLVDTGLRLSAADGERIIRLVASHVGAEVHGERPRVSAELPETGERFEGLLPPVVTAPAFAIRKPAVAVFSLDDYVAQGIMTAAQAAMLRLAVAERRNLLIAGGTSTGKTTLANALLKEIAAPGDRVVLIEDTRELQLRGAERRGAPDQGRRDRARRAGALQPAAAARPDPDRRGAGPGGPRPAEGLGHRPSRRHRHHPCRLGPRRPAPARAADPGSRR